MISAVIFDFDGTIIDTESSEFSTVQDVFREHGHEYTMETFLQGVGRADGRHWVDVLQEFTGPLEDIDTIKEKRRLAHRDMIDGSELRPGVMQLVERAENQEKALAVASSSPLSWVDRHLTVRGLNDRFQFIATRDLVERAKPWPDVFLAAAEGLEIDPRECLVIEDSHHGVVAAKAAGMTCVAVANPVTAGSDFTKADLVLESLAELPYDDFGL